MAFSYGEYKCSLFNLRVRKMSLKIFKAYFEEGRDIGDPEVPIELAESSGLSREEVEQAWQDVSLEQQLQEIATNV